MLSKKLTEALSSQINKEMASAYLYLGMATHVETEGLRGCAHWLKKQAKEELDHAMKIYEFIFDADSVPILEKLDAPKTKFGTPEEVFREILKHEQFVTESINKLYELALSEKDYKTQTFLVWFINEQVEEEADVRDILDRFKYIGTGGCGLAILDKELGERE